MRIIDDGPKLIYSVSDILLEEKGAGSYDELRVRRIYPPGTRLPV